MNYFYEATDGSGQTVLGKLDADNLAEARRMLNERGYRMQSLVPNPAPVGAGVGDSITLMGDLNRPGGISAAHQIAPASSSSFDASRALSVSNQGSIAAGSHQLIPEVAPAVSVPAQPAVRLPVSSRGGVSKTDLLLFFQQLTPLVRSGMTVYTALENLSRRTPNRALSDVSREMSEAARKGGRITDVMARYPRIFPEHIVGTVRAGELGGFLEIVLGEVALNYEQNMALYRGSWKWKALVLQAFIGLALVLPLMGTMLATMDVSTNIRLYIRDELVILPLFAGIYFLAFFVGKRIQEPHMQRWRDRMSLKMPVFGDLQRQSALSAFVRMLRKLYNAGVGPIHAWEAAMYTADNTVIRDKLAASYAIVQRGGTLAEAFAATGLFGDGIEQILVTGQLSGEVVSSLDQAANVYQNRVADAHDRARSMLWRMARLGAIILGGGAVLWLVYTYFHGIFNFVDNNFGS